MQSEGLDSVPVTDLQAIVSRITASRAAAAAAGSGASPDADTAAAATAAAAAGGGGESTTNLPALAPEQMPGAWKALASVAGRMVEDVFKPVAFIENMTTDTQVRMNEIDVYARIG
jgi:hypothetical protein